MMSATKTSRQQTMIDLLNRYEVTSQAELSQLLRQHGIETTPSTVSRDLLDLDAVRVRRADGALVYAVPAEGGDRTPRPGASTAAARSRLDRLAHELVVSVSASANLAVIRTPPGAAQFLASAIDHTAMDDVLGTIAGDDTVMLISALPDGGAALVERFSVLADLPTEDQGLQ